MAFLLVGGGSSVLRAWGWVRVRERLVEIGEDTPRGPQRMISMIWSYLNATDIENILFFWLKHCFLLKFF